MSYRSINKIDIFDYDDYRNFLNDVIEHNPKYGRGVKSRIADELDCKPSYVTHIFKRKLDCTPEQAIKIASFFKLNEYEKNFFITLVNYSRAGSQDLKNQLKGQLKFQCSIYKAGPKSNINLEREDSEDDVSHKYLGQMSESWIYGAVLLIVTSSEDGITTEELSERLNVNRQFLREAIGYLTTKKVIYKSEGKHFRSDDNFSIIPENLISQKGLHISWRSKVIQDVLTRPEDDDLHITMPIATNEKQFKIIKKMLKDSANNIIEYLTGDIQRDDQESSSFKKTFTINIDLSSF